MRFTVAEEQRLFAESIRAAIGDWRPPAEPELGSWEDDRDEALAERVTAAGWAELWNGDEFLAAAVAGATELGRAAAPLCLVDEPTLGAPLAVEGRARHARDARSVAVPLRGGGLGLGPPEREPRPELTLDGNGTVLVGVVALGRLDEEVATRCWRAWNAAMLGYFAGLARQALELAVEHARTREQFGAALASLPAVQSRLADAALAADALELVAWSAPTSIGLQDAELRWAGATCCDVTAAAHQVHGAIGFALETGLHVYHRRARSAQAWAAAVCSAAR